MSKKSKLSEAYKKFNENRYTVDDEELAIVNGNF